MILSFSCGDALLPTAFLPLDIGRRAARVRLREDQLERVSVHFRPPAALSLQPAHEIDLVAPLLVTDVTVVAGRPYGAGRLHAALGNPKVPNSPCHRVGRSWNMHCSLSGHH